MKNPVSVAATMLAVMLAACSSSPIDTSSNAPAAPNSANRSGPTFADSTSGKSQATVRSSTSPARLDSDSNLTKERSVFFAFDEAIIDQQYLSMLEKHGKYLAVSPSVKVKIEGNTDERGSAEYNLALGQKRAEATMKALRLLGVRESQMEPVSWGEEHPQDKGRDDAAYSRNRRADIVYPKQ